MKIKYIILPVLVGILFAFYSFQKKPTLIDVYPKEDKWWGKEPKEGTEDESIRKFVIPVDNEMLADLKTRLSNTRYFNPIVEDNVWIRGTHPHFTKELVSYWKDSFNWAAQVDYLNSYDNFKTNINGLDIHFVHVKAKRGNSNMKVTPLLLLHGWPGSFFEFYGAIPYLTDPAKTEKDFAFDVVVPSLPGYGFSEATLKKGLTGADITQIMAKLMKRLGYSSYIVQGGDYGSFFAKMMPVYDPEHCIGVHLNMYPVQTPWYAPIQLYLAHLLGPGVIFNELDHRKYLPFGKVLIDVLQESGYSHLQATRPYTLAHGLTDSPVGLAAYIIEKFFYWSDNQGDIYNTFTKDQLLTNVMIYWVNNCISSSVNYYYEILADVNMLTTFQAEIITTPTAIADFKHEMPLAHPPKSWAARAYKNIVQYNQIEKGGHFAAMEQPAAFAKDVINFGVILAQN